MTAVLPGTTLARSAALAHAIRGDLEDARARAEVAMGVEPGRFSPTRYETALAVAVEGLLTLARQGHGAPVIERILAEVAEVLGIIEKED